MAKEEIEKLPFKEGEVINNILYQRIIRENKNMIMGVFGKTGSGKSYCCLRMAELWYKKKFKKEFPLNNICFTPEELFLRLRQPINRGDLIIYEEAGVSMGSLDFQNKIAKNMNYVLQSFRSMNICLLMNLPYFTMLNKQTRMLMHMRIMTYDIDKSKKEVVVKPQWLSYSQDKPEPYHPRIQVGVGDSWEMIDVLNYGLPSENLREEYEKRKEKFLKKTIEDSHEIIKKDDVKKGKPKEVSKEDLELINKRMVKKMTLQQLSEEYNLSIEGVRQKVKKIEENLKKLTKP